MNKKIEPTEVKVTKKSMEEILTETLSRLSILEIKIKDMDNRVLEIEMFRNHASVERKINTLFERIEEINTSIDTLKRQIREMTDVSTEGVAPH